VKDDLALIAYCDEELARLDPVVMNLLVAKGIPSLAHLDISHYVKLCDSWARKIADRLARIERRFYETPWDWKNDINFFRLGVVCEFLHTDVGIAYNDDQRQVTAIRYTDPSDLFLNGVLDTRRGTCGNMAALHVALGWRFGWPVSLACAKCHFVCRYDDGNVTHNIEATNAKEGAFASATDEQLIKEYNLPPIAIACGSDLRAVKPREMLGLFFGLRGRHLRDSGHREEAELDYLLARHCFPNNRVQYTNALALMVGRGPRLFERREIGSPDTFPSLVRELEDDGIIPVMPSTEQAVRDEFFLHVGSYLEA
jgi:hypothetical protein